MSLIAVKQVSKRFGEVTVLEDVNVSVNAGEIYGLIGPSGAGKTTLVKMIVGMEQADEGEIHMFGEKMPNLPVLKQVGYMAQSDALYTELSGIENLRFFGELYGLKKSVGKERLDYVAQIVNLQDDLKKKVAAYSGGMKRRLSLAIALLHDPEVLILDEPTVGMDPVLRLTIWNELIRLKEAQKTIIVTTHVMDEADRCERLAMIRNGKVIVEGTPLSLRSMFHVDSLEKVFLHAGREVE